MKRLKQLSNWCYRVINRPVLLTALIVFLFFMVVVLPAMADNLADITGVEESPDTSLIYSAEDLYSMAEAYGEEGRSYYIYSRYTFDFLWPAAYLFFLTATLTYLFRSYGSASPWRLVNLLPFGGAFFDILENSAASLVMYRYPLSTTVVAQLAPVFTFTKWLFIFLSFTALIYGLLLAGRQMLLGNKGVLTKKK